MIIPKPLNAPHTASHTTSQTASHTAPHTTSNIAPNTAYTAYTAPHTTQQANTEALAGLGEEDQDSCPILGTNRPSQGDSDGLAASASDMEWTSVHSRKRKQPETIRSPTNNKKQSTNVPSPVQPTVTATPPIVIENLPKKLVNNPLALKRTFGPDIKVKKCTTTKVGHLLVFPLDDTSSKNIMSLNKSDTFTNCTIREARSRTPTTLNRTTLCSYT